MNVIDIDEEHEHIRLNLCKYVVIMACLFLLLFKKGDDYSFGCCMRIYQLPSKKIVSIWIYGYSLKPFTQALRPSVPPLSDQKTDQDAYRSPEPRRFCFCVRFCSPITLVSSFNHQNCWVGTTCRSKGAEWRQGHCHAGWMVALITKRTCIYLFRQCSNRYSPQILWI